ncbi:DUF4920 domain-containing protein [Balneola sp. MJW-20]|uniref:DUF4920 domain-containing protein n=1 Tax=Gracilimonas aurantiaca TaxID=3234185 RepID=UPI0034669BBD
MRNLILSAIISLTSLAVAAQDKGVIRLSEPVIETDTYEVFGESNYSWEQALNLHDVIRLQDDYINKEVLIESQITQVCQKKGCFFITQSEGFYARITFKDYSFFIPTNTAGKTVLVKGVFNLKELSAEQSQHYQEDLTGRFFEGALATQEYSIIATSILIPKD